MKKLCFFDTVCLVALIMLFFTVGLHLGKERNTDTEKSAVVTVNIVRSKLPKTVDSLFVDGKHECELLSINESSLSISCSGKILEAGFLAFGSKYLSKNQPLELTGDGAYVYGRITSIAIRE